MRSGARASILVTMQMDAPDATFTNGRYELPPSARGVLVLADPPEAGWRLQPLANEPATADCKPLSAADSGLLDRSDWVMRRAEQILEIAEILDEAADKLATVLERSGADKMWPDMSLATTHGLWSGCASARRRPTSASRLATRG